MGVVLLPQNTRELWREWEMRLLVLLSLFLQLSLATQGSRRKSIFRNWIQVVVWTMYLADSMETLALSVLSNRLANITETKGTIDPKSQMTAFWAPFLLLHLGRPDAVTAYALPDNDLWLRQLARLCIQVGLVWYIYSMALSGSTLSILAAGMILVGLIKYAERTLCLYWASKGLQRDWTLSCHDVGLIYRSKMKRFNLEDGQANLVGTNEITLIPALEDLSPGDKEVVIAYELFKIFKLLFVGLTVNSVLDVSHRMFMGPEMGWAKAFKIVEIELGFMYDQLFTKAPLLNCFWGIIRWVINLSVLCTVLVFFSLQDKKDYPKVDICITFLLIIGAILLEICSLLQAISSDWVDHWRLRRPRRSTISSAVCLLLFSPRLRWSNSVAQFCLLRSSIRKRNSIFHGEVVEKNFYIDYEELKGEIKELIFDRMKETVPDLISVKLKSALAASLKLEACGLLKTSNCDHLCWSVEAMEFEQSILIWHIATELCHYKDWSRTLSKEEDENSRMSMLVSRYMLYLLVFYRSMLPTGIGVFRYQDTLIEAQEFFKEKLAVMSKKETSIISLAYKKWAQKLFKKENHVHTGVESCNKAHESRESRDLCELRYLLLQGTTDLLKVKFRGGTSMSVLFFACHLADQLKSVDTWDIISKIWVRMLIYAACQCKGYEHCRRLSKGGELLSHVWLLTAHLGIAQPVQTSGEPSITITDDGVRRWWNVSFG